MPDNLEKITELWQHLSGVIDRLEHESEGAEAFARTDDSRYHLGRIKNMCSSMSNLMNDVSPDMIEVESWLAEGDI